MRAVECIVEGCGHVHAPDDERLIREVMRHAGEVHPEMRLDDDAARRLVHGGGYEDAAHGGARGRDWKDVAGWMPGGGTGFTSG